MQNRTANHIALPWLLVSNMPHHVCVTEVNQICHHLVYAGCAQPFGPVDQLRGAGLVSGPQDQDKGPCAPPTPHLLGLWGAPQAE